MPMTAERKAEIDHILATIPLGPWKWKDSTYDDAIINVAGDVVMEVIATEEARIEASEESYEFLANSRAIVDELRQENARLQALAADGEKYRRLCELMTTTGERVQLDFMGVYRALVWGNKVELFNDKTTIACLGHFVSDDPLAALEAAVKKAEEADNAKM